MLFLTMTTYRWRSRLGESGKAVSAILGGPGGPRLVRSSRTRGSFRVGSYLGGRTQRRARITAERLSVFGSVRWRYRALNN